MEKLQKIYGTLAQEGGAAPGDGRAPVVFLEAVMESYEGKMGLHFHSLMANALRIAE